MLLTDVSKNLNLSETEQQGIVGKVFYKYKFVDASKPLLVMFGSMNMVVSEKEAISKDFSPWGFTMGTQFLKVNVLCFMSYKQSSWYQCENFSKWLLSQAEFLSTFNTRLGYGSSMGGFGVAKFASVLMLDRVLLMNPISTLDPKRVSWETRLFGGAAETLDWNLDFSDGAQEPMNGVIVFDPLFGLDKQHARRLKGLREVFLPGVGHQIPEHLKNMGILKWLIKRFVDQDINFYELATVLRRRRNYSHYYEWLLSSQNSHHITSKRRLVIEEYKKSNVNEKFDASSNRMEPFYASVKQLALSIERYDGAAYDKLEGYVRINCC